MSREAFEASIGFELDPFQRRALDALDAGNSVLVAAPTGSGKTVVAEYAVARALAGGHKAFYTTPLKALSNQKFLDLVHRHGADRVGLLTGDNAVNGTAPVVVMTTEVLRNMIYARSGLLADLQYVVLDEVHYLQNPYRGAVWEEVIIHAPAEVDLVCLSATVSNAEEVADWIQTVRGATAVIIEETRPVELQHLYLVGDRSTEKSLLMPTFVDGRPNPEVTALEARASRHAGPRGRVRTRLFTPRRVEVVDRLWDEGMLPAIYFVFSRAGCDEAVRACVDAGIRLTTPEERVAIRAIVDGKVEGLTDDELDVLDYHRWVTGLEAGVAAHHAGMVPPFKEAVELAFAQALVKAVFATETLSLGINMPARTVVIEKLTKWGGDRHERLTPGEYTQLTGRAGRRGIDPVGHAVVLWSPYVPFDQVASLASRRTYELTSSFRPTYNMAANLVRRYPADTAHHLLNLSFAQYRADSAVVRLETYLDRKHHQIESARRRAACDRGDVAEYVQLHTAAERAARQRPSDQSQVAAALARARPGDVLVVPGRGRVAVISTRERKGGLPHLQVVTTRGFKLTLAPRDFPAPPRAVGRVELPVPFAPNNRGFLSKVAEALRQAAIRTDGTVGIERRGEEAMARAEAAAAHPVAGCPDVAEHVAAHRRVSQLEEEATRLERSIRSRTESLARQFDRVLRVLEAWGYVDGWTLTARGERLARVYHESDLLVAECVETGLLDDLDPPAMAGLVSTFCYEARGREDLTRWFPSRRVRDRWSAIDELATQLNHAEEDAGLPLTRRPAAEFLRLAYAWAAGEDLDEVIGEEEITGGDFVRNIKLLIDLLRQVGEVASEPATAKSARDAADRLFRGVVAASSVIGAS